MMMLRLKLSRHTPAFFSTLTACFSAFLAMFRTVFAALFATSFANVGTYTANFFCFFTAKTHKLRCCCTDSGTFHIQLNTTCHPGKVFFPGAGGCTMVTDGSTAQTGFNTGLMMIVSVHGLGLIDGKA
jgi:hypothetical protein